MFVFKKEKKKGRKIFILLHVTGPTVIMLHMNIFLQQLGRVFLSDNYYIYEQPFSSQQLGQVSMVLQV